MLVLHPFAPYALCSSERTITACLHVDRHSTASRPHRVRRCPFFRQLFRYALVVTFAALAHADSDDVAEETPVPTPAQNPQPTATPAAQVTPGPATPVPNLAPTPTPTATGTLFPITPVPALAPTVMPTAEGTLSSVTPVPSLAPTVMPTAEGTPGPAAPTTPTEYDEIESYKITSPTPVMTIPDDPSGCDTTELPSFRYAASSGIVGNGRLCELTIHPRVVSRGLRGGGVCFGNRRTWSIADL